MSGFYKIESGRLLHAANVVYAPGYELRREDRQTYDYPVDGWQWFDTEREAHDALGIPSYQSLPIVASVPPGRLHKLTVVERLIDAGLLEAAFTAMGGPGSPVYERWQASVSVDPLHPDVRGLLSAIGADVNAILASE